MPCGESLDCDIITRIDVSLPKANLERDHESYK